MLHCCTHVFGVAREAAANAAMRTVVSSMRFRLCGWNMIVSRIGGRHNAEGAHDEEMEEEDSFESLRSSVLGVAWALKQ